MKDIKTDLSKWKSTKLSFNGHDHVLATVIAVAQGGPIIAVKLSDLAIDSDVPDNRVLIEPHSAELANLELIVYKHNGKFLILTGHAIIAQAKTDKLSEIKARLLSTPALKRARVIPDQPVQSEPSRPAVQPSVGYTSRPSYGNRRYGNDR